MPKIKKLKRKKKFRANVNRKRLRNKLRKLPNIECKQIKEAWEGRASTCKNMEQMGLAYDPNKVLKIPNFKKDMLKVVKNGREENEDSDTETVKPFEPKKKHVAESLEEEAKWPRAKLFRLPNSEIQFLTYLMDKHGDDYEAMARDRKNHYQLTASKIKGKINRFKNIPEQYAEYLVKKGEIVLDDPIPLKKIKPQLLEPTIEKKTNPKKLSRRKRQKMNILEAARKEVEEEDEIKENSDNIDDDDDNDNIDFNVIKTVSDVEVKYSQNSGEKKLQLFPEDDVSDCDSNQDHEDDNDQSDLNDNDDVTSDSEDDINTKIIKAIKNKKIKDFQKSKTSKQKAVTKSSITKNKKVTKQKNKLKMR